MTSRRHGERPFPGMAVAACLLALGLAGCETPEMPGEGTAEVTLELGNRADAPLLIVLHGPGGSASRLRRIADFGLAEQGWTIAWPDARGAGWMDPATDEAGRIAGLIGRLGAANLVDPQRVFLAGFSDGGQLALRMACDEPGVVAGVAAVMASLPGGATCEGGEPVPVLLFNATTDPVLPYTGGEIARPALPKGLATIRLEGPVMSAGDTAAIVSRRNACGAARIVGIPDLAPEDGATVIERVYEGCAAPVRQFVIEGGGHAWPGSSLNREVASALGEPVRDISATLEIEAFAREVAGEARAEAPGRE